MSSALQPAAQHAAATALHFTHPRCLIRVRYPAAQPVLCLLLTLQLITFYVTTAPTRRQDRAFNLQFLKEEFDIGPEQIEALYQFAKFQFDCGNYSMASELLQVRRECFT